MKVSAVIPAAGSGSRMGGETPKQFLSLADIPVVTHALKAFETVSDISEILLVVPPRQEDRCHKEWIEPYGLKKTINLIPGGPHRQDSVYAGLLAIHSDTDIVLVHDGVRPFVTPKMINESIQMALRYPGAVVAVAVKDTPKVVNSKGEISSTLDRSTLLLAQTPQAFPRSVLIEAYQRAYTDGVYNTDDSALVERLGLRVKIIPGAWYNLKITKPEDLLLAEKIFAIRQIPGVED